MQPASTVLAFAAALTIGLLAASLGHEATRAALVAVMRHIPLLRRLVVGAVVLAAVTRAAPATATMPPPILRFDLPRSAATPGADPVQSPDPRQGAAEQPTAGGAYIVRPGDSLWAIACRALRSGNSEPPSGEVDALWRRIYAANRDVIGEDPDLIHPGDSLAIPAIEER